MKRIILAALVGVLVSGPAWGAEFTWLKDRVPRLLIEGIIKAGDFEKFRNKLVEKGKPPTPLYLNSPGGDLREALKIGRLVRKLRLNTTAPILIASTKELVCWKWTTRVEIRELKKGDECICASACFFIYVAGVDRNGGYDAVHRPYVKKQGAAEISLGSYIKEGADPVNYLR